MKTGYLAPEGLEKQLEGELENVVARYGRLLLADGPPQKTHWTQNIWYDPQIIPFTSITDAAKKLRSLQKLWAYYPHQNIRRGELIAQNLPYFSPKPLPFLGAIPEAPLGSWTLLGANTLLASPRCSSMFAHGEIKFEETKIPPSRAYLKLWEFFTRMRHYPKAGEVCLELGASPGGWTWVLDQLGAETIAVDRSPLDPMLSHVKFLKKDAFALEPKDFPQLDWLFSDVICYPDKLLAWLTRWLEAKPDLNVVCTIKFQGEEEYRIIDEFEKIQGSHVVHLSHNKHELTWYRLKM